MVEKIEFIGQFGLILPSIFNATLVIADVWNGLYSTMHGC